MNEKNKFKIVMVVFAVIIALIVIMSVVESNNQKKQLEIFNEYFSSSTEKLIYFAKDGCYYCQLLKPAREKVLDANNIDYYYVDTDSISTAVLDKMLDKLEITNFGTPTLVVVKDNGVVKVQSGVFTTDTDNVEELAEFINEHNVADLTDFIEDIKSKESE